MTGDIVAFIRARLDEDAAIAEIISPGGYAPQEWRDVTPKNAAGWHEIRAFDRTNTEPPEAAQDEGGEPVAVVPGGRLEHEHIARHDPARVLREVEAKRRLLEHVWRYEERIDQDRGCCCDWEKIAAGLCQETPLARIEALRDFAVVWSDHPDYRQEWTP